MMQHSPAPGLTMDKLTALKTYFGHSSFRPGQETMIDALLAGRDAFGVMPTGAGKSVCYQLPALLLPGVTVVISPLISLMKDQVTALEQSGLPAACLNSTQTSAQQAEVLSGARLGVYKLLYVAPERLTSENFLSAALRMDISLVVVDEAHCVSQWGQDFRPSYLDIAAFVQQLPRRPVLGAFTATATAQVKRDIVRLLGLQDPVQITTGFDRPNLYFEVLQPQNKFGALRELLEKRREQCGIVYCSTRKSVEQVTAALCRLGFSAAQYHAGLPDAERHRSQEDFIFDRVRIMVATNAFGMGIDKSNVGFVIHYNMPMDLESYYQEAGRAGRDGMPADCLLLYSGRDVATARFMIEHSEENEKLTPEERRQLAQRDMQRLSKMVDYCETGGCLRGYLLRYFGEDAPGQCGNCGNCLGDYEERDITIPAQKILSCIIRAERMLGYALGRSSYVLTLRGSRDHKILDKGLDTLSTYGILNEPEDQVYAYLSALEAQGYLRLSDGEYPTVSVTPRAGAVLRGGETVMMRSRRVPEKKLAEKKQRALGPMDEQLFAELRQLRMKLARQAGVPAYAVFSDATLREMSAAKPQTEEAFLQVSGVGEAKLRRYGDLFLAAIGDYVDRRTK